MPHSRRYPSSERSRSRNHHVRYERHRRRRRTRSRSTSSSSQRDRSRRRQRDRRRRDGSYQRSRRYRSIIHSREIFKDPLHTSAVSVSLSDTAATRSPPSSAGRAADATVAASGRSLCRTASSDMRTSPVALTTAVRSGMPERRRGAADAHADSAGRELDREHARTVRAGPYHP